MTDTHDPLTALSAAAALEDVRLRQADLIAAEAALDAAIDRARPTPGVTMDQIATELNLSRDGLYKRLRARGRQATATPEQR